MSKVGTPKVTGSSLTAGEHNSFLIQEERIITNAGGTLQIDDFVQKGQAITSYVGIATFLEDISVTANTIVLAPQTTANFDLPINNPATWNGLLLRFRPIITNTGASTVDFGYSAINIVNESGNALTGGELVTTRDAFLRYDLATTSFILLNSTLQSQVEANTTNIVTNALNITALQELQDKPITFSYSSATVINYTAGGFIFDDKTGSAIVTADSVDFATNGLNGLDTGSLSANTWYYLFGIYNPTTQISGVIASTSKTTPTLPSGFTKKKYLNAALKTNASSQFQTFTQMDNKFVIGVTRQIFNSTATPTTIATITSALPLGKCSAQVKLGISVAGAGFSNFCIWGSEMPTPVNGARAGEAVSVGTNNSFGADSQGDVYTSNGNLFVVSTLNNGGVSLREAHLHSYTIFD